MAYDSWVRNVWQCKDGYACRVDLYATGAAWEAFRDSAASLGRVQRREINKCKQQ
ncbi:unnamed protein product, partial [Symbiodinium sp. KB8]